MNRVISYGLQAREELAKGAKYLAECVKSTLGPYGSNWYLDKKNAITNDGVTVAREIHLTSSTKMPDGKSANEFNNRGAAALREAAIKTVEEVGDGTTTSIILGEAIYDEASRLLASEGVLGKKTPAELREQVEEERQYVTEKLEEMATPITTEEQLIKSATVSMGDKVLGEMIGKAQWKLGPDGFILVEEDASPVCSVEYVRGITVDNGVGTGTLINNQEKQVMEVEKTKIVLTSYTIKTVDQFKKWIAPIAEKVQKMQADSVVIMARAWTDETLQLCLLNIQKGAVKIYPVNAPYINMREKMKDLSALTGATFFDSESTRLEDLQPSDIGYAEKVVAQRMQAVITGADNPESTVRVEKRLKELNDELNGTKSDFEVKHISERVAQLNNGFAILKVGAQSQMERRRLFDKCDDAVNAVRAAYQEGTVKGAGLAFKEISETMGNDALLKRPLLTVYQQIISSAPKGFVIEDWVRDPLKVLRIALENACAVAVSFAMAGGVVTDERPKDLDSLFRKQLQEVNSNE